MKTKSITVMKGNHAGGRNRVTRTKKLGCPFLINSVDERNYLSITKMIGHSEHLGISMRNPTLSENQDKEIEEGRKWILQQKKLHIE